MESETGGSNLRREVARPRTFDRNEKHKHRKGQPTKLGRDASTPVPVDLAVGAVARELARTFNRDVWFTGELVQFKTGRGGHGFGVLRGTAAKVDVYFAPRFVRSGSPVSEGSVVLVRGRIGLWAPGGRFQIAATSSLIPTDLPGAHSEARRIAERTLRSEGVFDRARRKLPEWPAIVAVVTSARGAAVHDVLAVVRRRAPWVQVRVHDCVVQGRSAAASILTALDAADRSNADVIILTRGGGECGDFDPFDDISVVRRVATSRIPIVVAIGHHIDQPLAELAADTFASTPTAAAEIAVPDAKGLRRDLGHHRHRMHSAARSEIVTSRYRVDESRGCIRREAHRTATLWRERLDRTAPTALLPAMRRLVRVARTRAADVRARIQSDLAATLRGERLRAVECYSLVTMHGSVAVRTDRHRAADAIRAIRGLSPDHILARGYALVTDAERTPVRASAGIREGQHLLIRFHDGEVAAVAITQPRPITGGGQKP